MKVGDAIVKKCCVVLLTNLYLFIAVTYLLYLPKFSALRITSSYLPAKSQLEVKTPHHVNNTGANVLVLIHRAYKSTIENKRQMFSKLLQIGVAFVYIIAGSGLRRQQLMSFVGRAIKTDRSQQYTYLCYCVLRI
jgi:hypothetical protein